MRIIRFRDENNNLCYGYNYNNNTAVLLNGEMFKGFKDTGKRVKVKEILTPLVPASILCIGLNYKQHAEETGARLPDHPALFMKNIGALNNPGNPVILPPSCLDPLQVDFEAELAVVIGQAAKDVSASEALDYVFGYTIGNDVSARLWQKEYCGGQWVKGKSFDTFCPLGPVLVTKDEIPDPQNLRLKSELNGKVMQDACTEDMIFPVNKLIEELSIGMTLLPGTVILTGTPSGVGFARNPQIFIKPGDELKITIEGIGELINPVAAG